MPYTEGYMMDGADCITNEGTHRIKLSGSVWKKETRILTSTTTTTYYYYTLPLELNYHVDQVKQALLYMEDIPMYFLSRFQLLDGSDE